MVNDAAADYTRAGYATAKHVLPDLSDPDSKAGLLEHLTKSKRTWLPTGRLAPLTGMPSKLHPDKIGFTDMPGEVRNQIYELALLTKFNHTAPAYEKRTRHRIPTGLLLGCRQIYEETKDTWYEENVFVEIITNWADLPEQFAAMGVPYFARQDGSTLKAGTRLQQRLKKPDITVYMVSIHQSRELQSQYWMAAEDLPTFAAAMWFLDRGPGNRFNATFKDALMRIMFHQNTPPSRSRQIAFLKPFQEFGRMWKVSVLGAVDRDLAVALQGYLMINPFRSPECAIEWIATLKVEGDYQSKLGNQFLSIVRYEQATAAVDFLSTFESPTRRFDASAGEYAGKLITCAKDFEIFRLSLRLALGYLALDLLDRAEAAATRTIGVEEYRRLQLFGMSDEDIAVAHYIMALVIYKNGLKTSRDRFAPLLLRQNDGSVCTFETSFEYARWELKECDRLLPKKAALLTHVSELRSRTYEFEA